MNRPIVKVCGVTSEAEIENLARAGVDYFGLVVDVPSPWKVSVDRARQLAAASEGRIRPTLVTRPSYPDQLVKLVQQIGVSAVQLPVLNSPQHVEQLRRALGPRALTIIQTIPHGRGQFWKDDQIGDYLAAGADFILIDTLEKTGGAGNESGTIPLDELAAFRERHHGQPILVAGGVTAQNVSELIAASGAVGVDVCSSLHRDGAIRPELVAQLMQRLSANGKSADTPSLRGALLQLAAGNHVVAYLTLGDPPDQFPQVVDEVLEAGAVALELGFPAAEPNEGEILTASHRRALDAGVDMQQAMSLLKAVAMRHPSIPLVAVVQWSSIQAKTERDWFLEALADARAAAVLAVGLPLWELPGWAAQVHERGLQTVIPCPPNASDKFLEIVLRFCSGCLYVPRGRVTGSVGESANVAEFCRHVAGRSDLPMIVGVGVKTAADVAEIGRTPAKAAAVGTALVDQIARGGSAGQFMRSLVSR